jgi:hypothetical protein
LSLCQPLRFRSANHIFGLPSRLLSLGKRAILIRNKAIHISHGESSPEKQASLHRSKANHIRDGESSPNASDFRNLLYEVKSKNAPSCFGVFFQLNAAFFRTR